MCVCVCVCVCEYHAVSLVQDQLVHCLQMCLSEFMRQREKGVEQGAESDDLPEPVQEARDVLESLMERMIDTQLDDFELVRERERESGRFNSVVPCDAV